jgi:hypothetical protein
MKLIEYEVVTKWDTVDLQEQVNLKIKQGWHPLGGLTQNGDGLKYQTMVKYEAEKAPQKLPNNRPVREMKSYVSEAKRYCELMGWGDGTSLTPERRSDIIEDLERLDLMMQALKTEKRA